MKRFGLFLLGAIATWSVIIMAKAIHHIIAFGTMPGGGVLGVLGFFLGITLWSGLWLTVFRRLVPDWLRELPNYELGKLNFWALFTTVLAYLYAFKTDKYLAPYVGVGLAISVLLLVGIAVLPTEHRHAFLPMGRKIVSDLDDLVQLVLGSTAVIGVLFSVLFSGPTNVYTGVGFFLGIMTAGGCMFMPIILPIAIPRYFVSLGAKRPLSAVVVVIFDLMLFLIWQSGSSYPLLASGFGGITAMGAVIYSTLPTKSQLRFVGGDYQNV